MGPAPKARDYSLPCSLLVPITSGAVGARWGRCGHVGCGPRARLGPDPAGARVGVCCGPGARRLRTARVDLQCMESRRRELRFHGSFSILQLQFVTHGARRRQAARAVFPVAQARPVASVTPLVCGLENESKASARDGARPRGLSGWAGRPSRAGLGESLAAVRLGRGGRLRRAGWGFWWLLLLLLLS